MRAAGDDPRALAVATNSGAVARNVARLGFEPDQISLCTLLLHLRQSVATDELAFAQLHGPTEAGFVRIDRLVHVVSVQAKGGFQASCVASAETGWQHPFCLAMGQDGVPCVPDPAGFDEELEPVLSRVTRPRG